MASNNMLQSFLRVANLFGPQDDSDAYAGMPEELPVGPRQPQLINRQGPSISVPGAYQDEEEPSMFGSPSMFGQPEEEESTLEAFRRNVLNPPQRQHMTYPKNTLAGLTEALKIAATPTDYEKNRVYIDGNAYQQVKRYKDPVTGETKFINKYKQPGFMEQVMKAMPAAVSPAVDILNQPYEDAVADWELKNKGFKEAAGAESAMALAGQRRAQAEAIPRGLDIKEMDAKTRQYLASLKDIPESEKLKMVQDGRMSLAAYQAQARYSLQELRGEQAQTLEGTRQLGREKLERIRQSGRISLEEVKSANDAELEQLKQSGRLDLEGTRQVNREILVRQRGEQARQTKATPSPASGATSQLPTQQKVAMQSKVSQILAENPEWEDYITINAQGFPVITPPDTGWTDFTGPDQATYDQMYQAIYGKPRSSAAPIAPPPATTTPPATTATAPAPAAKPAPKPAPKAPPKQSSGAVEMVTPDGKSTRMVPANQVEVAKRQGYKPKGKG